MGELFPGFFAPRLQRLLQVCRPYVVTYPGNLPHFDLSPWGITFASEHTISCLDHQQKRFFDFLQKLDALAFGPVGMPMDRWVFFDCGEMPGAIIGMGMYAGQLPPEFLASFQPSADRPISNEEFIPLSMYIAIPMAKKGCWFGHNLSSANRLLQQSQLDFKGLALFTKALAVKVMGIDYLYGATQWNSNALHIHLQLADMLIESAYTPAHTFPATMVYSSHYSEEGLQNALGEQARTASQYDFLVPSGDLSFYLRLQERIVRGEKFKIVGRPILKAAEQKYYLPVAECQ